ncbi:MAG: hypothetical protein LBB79_06125 [Prevotellaceae bacterium]|jgi:hypothetical protein|nr:hypothetical protein [Prevotellaceae bacterium]
MMKFFLKILFCTLLATLPLSCKYISRHTGASRQQKPLAVAGSKELHLENVKGIFPQNITEEDSLTLLRSYVDAWVKKELLLRLAEENLNSKQKDVSALLEDYRTSLLVYRYKQEYIERMDTTVSELECETFYSENKQYLTLQKPVVRALFIKLRKKSPYLERIGKIYTSTNPNDITTLEDLCLQAALKFDYYGNRWLALDELTKDLPPRQGGYEERAAQKRAIEVEDDEYTYLVAIRDFKERNAIAPLEYEYGNIKAAILNQRKRNMIDNLEQRMLQEAKEKNIVKIYVEN